MFAKLWRFLRAADQTASASASLSPTESKTQVPESHNVFGSRPYHGKSCLVISDTCTSISGILPRKPNGRSSGYLSLLDPSNAEISYIFGPDWQSRLKTTLSEGPKKEEHKFILVPDDQKYQANHCLLMRRCGALRLGLSHGDYLRSPDPLNVGMHQQIMGWPSYGGVCLLPRSKISDYRLTREELESIGVKDHTSTAENDPQVKKFMFGIKLRKQDDMDEFCKLLLEAGGKYFERIKECPQVLRLGLSTTDWMLEVIVSELSDRPSDRAYAALKDIKARKLAKP